VEEKLLIGDRPKQTADFDKKLSLRDRLLQQNPEELTNVNSIPHSHLLFVAKLYQLTSDEAKLVEYARALADWLEPYHNYARPPPSVVLAEAAKQTELKTGHPLKGIEIPTINPTNGHPKKDEEPPTIQEAPEIVLNYFDGDLSLHSLSTAPYYTTGIRARLNNRKSHSSPTELLHVATIAQEVSVLRFAIHLFKHRTPQAFLLFVVQTSRFKSPSVVKINKLSSVSFW